MVISLVSVRISNVLKVLLVKTFSQEKLVLIVTGLNVVIVDVIGSYAYTCRLGCLQGNQFLLASVRHWNIV